MDKSQEKEMVKEKPFKEKLGTIGTIRQLAIFPSS